MKLAVGIAVAVLFAALWWKATRIGEATRRARQRAEIWMHSHDRGQP